MHCYVLLPDRPTEYSEEHIYACEWKYIEGETENAMRKLSKSFKSPVVSTQVCDDEIYYFPKKILIKRVSIDGVREPVNQ